MEIYWIYYNIQKKEADFLEKLGSMLGTHWDEKTLLRIATRSESNDEVGTGNMFIPLALAINPDLLTVLKEARKPKSRLSTRDLPIAPPKGTPPKTLADYEPSKLTEYASKVMRSLKGP